MALQPSIRFVLRLLEPGGATTVYRWAKRPFADQTEWTEGRLSGWGRITRQLSTFDGSYNVGSTDVTVDDSDGLFRGLLSGATTRFMTAREGAIELLSEYGRAAMLPWRRLFRGRITDVQVKPGRKATIRLADEVGSHFTGFDLEKVIGVRITREMFPNAPEESINRIFPIVIGEHQDFGVVDVNGNPADKGLLPVVDVGDEMVGSEGTTPPGDVVRRYLSPPEVTVTVNGTPGGTQYVYRVTALSPYGETTPTTVTINNGPAVLNGTDNFTFDIVGQDGATGFKIYGRYEQDRKKLALVTSGTAVFVDDDDSYLFESTWPDVNGAQVDQADGTGETFYGWARLITKIGANAEVIHVYASDLNPGGSPKRVRMPESVYGSEFLVYGRPGWPHADPWVEVGGVRFGCIYARGPRLEQHRAGTVTITWNGCGDDEVGDGTGPTIDEAFKALQHVLNEYVLKDSGNGYRTGTFGPLEAYADGQAKLRTSAFLECQALTAEWIGDRGYLAAFAIVEPINVREFLRRFCITFACHVGSDHHGQMFPVVIPGPDTDPSLGRHYRDRIEVIRLQDQTLQHGDVETRVTYHYDWDTEAGAFRVTDRVVEDAAYSAAYFAPREKSSRECYYTRDQATAYDAASRHLARVKVAPRFVSFDVDLTGLEDEVGVQIRLTHYDGAASSAGDDATPMLVWGHSVAPERPETVTLTCLDLGRMLVVIAPAMGPDLTSEFILGDEESFAPPPVGAFELH